MSENYRKPIASLNKLPQFTTMNVIDGQAGLVSYSSLIFYSLTIDNILNIIVLLILAGVSIATLTGDNGILTQATRAKEKTEQERVREKISLSMQSCLIKKHKENNSKLISTQELKEQLNNEGLTDCNVTGNSNLIVVVPNQKSYIVKQNGEVLENNLETVLKQGDYVEYNSTSLSGGENWRVFYIDNNVVNIITTNPTEIIQATNNNVAEESEEKTKEFEKLLKEKRKEKISLNVGRDVKYGDEIETKELNYFSPELAENYALTITMEDIKKAIGISYTIGEPVSYSTLKSNDVNNLFPLSPDCYHIATYYGDFDANKNSLYMMSSNTGGLSACWLLQSAFRVGTKIRPIVQLKENLEIADGDGTLEHPYVLKKAENQ